jgi:hypothetical protein
VEFACSPEDPTMPRLSHGAVIRSDALEVANAIFAARSPQPERALAARALDLQDFDFMFPALQASPANLLPESPQTVQNLVALGRTMRDPGDAADPGDSTIPAVYTYFGQFIDHDITLETFSAAVPDLLSPGLTPLSLAAITATIRNLRTVTLDLDSVYGPPAPRDGDKLRVGVVTPLGGAQKPELRPPGKGDDNDLPREPRSSVPSHDRAALIGDPRNDENTIVSQLHTAFLRAHNAIVDRGRSFRGARRSLRRHYQHLVIHDFLKRIADPAVVDGVLRYGNRFYTPSDEAVYMPLEFSVGAFRFGHSMVRTAYDFNLNFNTSGEPGTFPATLPLLFTFTALSGGLGFGQGTDTLPDNWIVEWENLVEAGGPFNRARRIDTKLVEPLFLLPDILGQVAPDDSARLAVRNLLRGYLLRLPTGQAVAQAMGEAPLTPAEVEAAAASFEQAQALRDGGFLEQTPLWYYVLAEAVARGGGQHLGPVGSTIVAEVLIESVRRSADSVLAVRRWKPYLPSAQPGTFTLADLLRLAGVLS